MARRPTPTPRRPAVGTAPRRDPPANPRRWTPRLVALLGKVPDSVIARRARVSITTVLNERRRRGIPPWQPQRPTIQWTPEMIALLGQDTDDAVAAELGVHPASVARKRTMLGIPPSQPPSRGSWGFRWTERAIALLGTATDATVARRLGLTKTQVAYQRALRGIRPFGRTPVPIAWSKKMIALLGKLPDRVIARRFGISPVSVLGKRRQLGIPAHDASRNAPRRRRR